MFACWSHLSILKLQSIELKIAQLDDADALLPSKLNNSSSDDEDTTANITLCHVYINIIANYYNIL